MLALINSNRMSPPIAPIGLDYVATAARRAGIETLVIDLGLSIDEEADLHAGLASGDIELVGISFRNVDDSFWPSATWFVPSLVDLVGRVRATTVAPIVLGGVGLSIFARQILELTGADYAICGDGERAMVELYRAVTRRSPLSCVPGLVFRAEGRTVSNAPAWADSLEVPTSRDAIDNRSYYLKGGQAGVETKRGCPRHCIYCADPLAKGKRVRLRPPRDIADEFEALAGQGIEVIHLCDGEFNVHHEHAIETCAELTRRGLDDRVRWYTYASVMPFDEDLAEAMQEAGCIGVNFGADSASDAILAGYGQVHRVEDLAETVRLCRAYDLRCMIDLLLGGPGETPETVATTISALKAMEPDCVGAGLGMRIYPGTPAAKIADSEAGIRRRYGGPIDLVQPTFYISPALGPHPATLVQELIGNDERFFPPAEEASAGHAEGDHNYNDNTGLLDAIAKGARGAYWDILRQMRIGPTVQKSDLH